jgi:fructose-1,6-bisphosphatase II
MFCRFNLRKEGDLEKITACGIDDAQRILNMEDMAKGQDLSFTATGVIDGPLVKGVRFAPDYTITHSVAMRVRSGTVRYLETRHNVKARA